MARIIVRVAVLLGLNVGTPPLPAQAFYGVAPLSAPIHTPYSFSQR
jgi:hypothetical protein